MSSYLVLQIKVYPVDQISPKET